MKIFWDTLYVEIQKQKNRQKKKRKDVKKRTQNTIRHGDSTVLLTVYAASLLILLQPLTQLTLFIGPESDHWLCLKQGLVNILNFKLSRDAVAWSRI